MRKPITAFKIANKFALVRTPSARKPIVAPDNFSRLSSILESCRVHSMPFHFCAVCAEAAASSHQPRSFSHCSPSVIVN